MKQKFFDKSLIKLWWGIFSGVSSIIGFILAILGTPRECNIIILLSVVVFLIGVYIFVYLYYRHCEKIKFKIGKVDLTVKVGDIFELNGLKVIPVNEYFDTQVDNEIISHSTLHGKFVDKFTVNHSKEELDELIDKKLVKSNYVINNERIEGKKKKYPIGTTIIIDEYMLSALSKFDEDNVAYLSMKEYLTYLNTFWSNVNILHNGREVNVPIIGSGMARIDPILTDQEYLEQIIWSLKTSNLITSKCKINIIVYDGDKEKISLLRLKNVFDSISK